jgi:hypothetical protein
MNDEKGHATVMFSREELILLEVCLLLALNKGELDEDTTKDAQHLLQEIKVILGSDSASVADRIRDAAQELHDEQQMVVVEGVRVSVLPRPVHRGGVRGCLRRRPQVGRPPRLRREGAAPRADTPPLAWPGCSV